MSLVDVDMKVSLSSVRDDELVMRIAFVSAQGALSFDQFRLDLTERLTVVVGPNGAGKSNLARLLGMCQRSIECADERTDDLTRMLASFLAARHMGSAERGVEVRLGYELTEVAERTLVVEYVRAMVVGALLGNRSGEDTSGIDAWAATQITEDKLLPLMSGQIVASHQSTECQLVMRGGVRSNRSRGA